MSFKQFVASEGGNISKIVVGGLAAQAGAHSIKKDVRQLQKTRCCVDIKHKYRQLAKKHHTDKHGKQEDFIQLTEAKEKALETCDNACDSKNIKKHIKSSKKRAKARRKRAKNKKKKEESKLADLAAAGVVIAAVGYVSTKKPKKKIKHMRQSSEEDYKKATGHKRRY
jgi:hypothetical protein